MLPPMSITRGKLQCSVNMEATRIRELLRPFTLGVDLNDEKLTQLRIYLDLLLKWNAKTNLTAIREPGQIVQRHFGESLFAAAIIASKFPSASSLADVGSGAGFPGLPIKIALPDLQTSLIESKQKKVAFLREAIRALNLADARVLNARAEGLSLAADIVTLRAVESFGDALLAASNFVSAPGSLVLLVGSAQTEQAISLSPSFTWNPPEPIPLSNRTVILIGTKR